MAFEPIPPISLFSEPLPNILTQPPETFTLRANVAVNEWNMILGQMNDRFNQFNNIIGQPPPNTFTTNVDWAEFGGTIGAPVLEFDVEQMAQDIAKYSLVATIADLSSLSLPVGAVVSTKGCLSVGDGGHGSFIVEAASGTPDGYGRVLLANGNHGVLRPVNGLIRKTQFGGDMQKAISAAKGGFGRVLLDSGETVFIPAHAAVMQDAFDYTTIRSGSKVAINIQTGHALTHGLRLEAGDWSGYSITAADAITYLSSGFVGVNVETTASSAVIAGKSAIMPLLACLIQADDRAEAGYQCYAGSSGRVAANCGVTYAAKFGIYVSNGSRCNAPASNFSYCGLVNRVTTNSQLEAEGINCSSTQNRGYPDPNNDRGALDVSRGSIVNIKSQGTNITNLSNSAGNGLSVRRSFVSAEQINATNCARVGIRAEASATVAAGSSILAGCTYGVFASNGSNVDVQGATITNCVDYAIFASRAAKISANAAICTGTTGIGRAVYATEGATIDAAQSDASGALAVGYYATHDGSINARGAVCDMTGSGAASNAVFADYGGKINAGLGTFSNSTSGQDIRCTRGSTIPASGSTGVLSKAANTLDVNGVIYR